MPFEMPKCKITVLKRTINQDLIDAYLDDEYKGISLCDCFRDGQEILVEDYSVVPEGFCASAWADIRKDIDGSDGGQYARDQATGYCHHRLHRLVQTGNLQGREDGK